MRRDNSDSKSPVIQVQMDFYLRRLLSTMEFIQVSIGWSHLSTSAYSIRHKGGLSSLVKSGYILADCEMHSAFVTDCENGRYEGPWDHKFTQTEKLGYLDPIFFAQVLRGDLVIDAVSSGSLIIKRAEPDFLQPIAEMEWTIAYIDKLHSLD